MTEQAISERKSDSLVFLRPRARLVSILGENLISDHVVCLLELVKNAYDADATHVRIGLDGLHSLETTRILVEDNGSGMTLAAVTERFLSPAVDHKARQKRANRRTRRGRLPIGEKGVGRFAVQQLGHRLRLATRVNRGPEVVTEIDWDQFEHGDTLLSDVPILVGERRPVVFRGRRRGTRLVIEGARQLWTESAVRKLQRGLRRLQSPHLSGSRASDFEIVLLCPEYPDCQSLKAEDILSQAHYTLDATIDSAGQTSYQYGARHPATAPRRAVGTVDLAPSVSSELDGGRPQCGPFRFCLYVWDRTAEYLKASATSRSDLDSMAGFSLFRDGLRVLPYGEPGDDWLYLDRDRVNHPSERIGNRQVVGFVEVLQHETPDLRDKTNREGLIDNHAFRDLRALARAAIAFFHTLWQQDRPAVRQPALPDRRVAAEHLEQAIQMMTTVGEDEEEPHRGGPRGGTELVASLRKAVSAHRMAAESLEFQRETLFHLATTGMAAERVVHEVGRQVVPALEALQEIRRTGELSGSSLAILECCLGTLRNEFRSLAPYEGVNRFERSARLSVRAAIDRAVFPNRSLLTGAAVNICGGDFDVETRPSALIQVLDNLIANASWWVQTTVNPQVL